MNKNRYLSVSICLCFVISATYFSTSNLISEETFTILNLMEKSREVLYHIDVIYYLNHDVLEAIPVNCDPFEKACRLLHVLWQHLSHLSVRDRSSSSVRFL